MRDLPTAYRDAIASSHPQLVVRSADLLDGEGMVNDVVVVNDELVFRFPKRAEDRAAQRREARILDLVRDRVGVSVPAFEVLEDAYGAYRKIPGVPATRAFVLRLPEAARRRLLGDVLGFVSDLHGVPTEALRRAGVGPSAAQRDLVAWRGLYADVRTHLFPHLMRYQRDAVEEAFAPVLAGELPLVHAPRLIHGDLGPYHLLAAPDTGRLRGVIDFGTAGLGDPAADVGMLLSVWGESLVAAAADAYPEMRDWIDRARFFAFTLELQWALAGLVRGDRALAVAHVAGARDVMPLGAEL